MMSGSQTNQRHVYLVLMTCHRKAPGWMSIGAFLLLYMYIDHDNRRMHFNEHFLENVHYY